MNGNHQSVRNGAFNLLLSIAMASAVLPPPQTSTETRFATAYWVASKLTDPICTAHRWLREVNVVHALHPQASKIERVARQAFLYAGAVASATFSLLTTPAGIALRYISSALQARPFSHYRGEAQEIAPQKSISLLSWNLCCVPGGYSITDGGVLPWSYRIHELISAIRKENADVVTLYEIFDIQTAHHFIEGLKDQYSHFYYHIGPRTIGPSSGLFVASKFRVDNPEFELFPQEAKDGRAKHSSKGCFSFDIPNFAKLYTTHLNHSEIVKSPTSGEVKARNDEMHLILKKMDWTQNIIFTGDLNLDDTQEGRGWKHLFNKGQIHSQEPTWGGDRHSPASNLDYTMVRGGLQVQTHYVETRFERNRVKHDALSDHRGLHSRFTLKKKSI